MSDKFTSAKPTAVGLYEIKCRETDSVREYVAITVAPNGGLQVHDNGLGITDLERFHSGLTFLKWRHVA